MVSYNGRTKKMAFSIHIPEAAYVSVLGDFNGWNEDANPMKKNKNGTWACEIKLEPGDYQFKYRVDRSRWMDDDSAPRTANQFGSENSVARVEPVAAAPRKPRKAPVRTARKK